MWMQNNKTKRYECYIAVLQSSSICWKCLEVKIGPIVRAIGSEVGLIDELTSSKKVIQLFRYYYHNIIHISSKSNAAT